MTRQQQFDLWCKSFGYDPSRDSRGEFRNHTARLLWEAYLRGAQDENDRCTEACFEYAKTLAQRDGMERGFSDGVERAAELIGELRETQP